MSKYPKDHEWEHVGTGKASGNAQDRRRTKRRKNNERKVQTAVGG